VKARIPNCEFKEEGCNDPGCKIGSCLLEIEERDELARQAFARRERIHMAAEAIAHEYFKRKYKRNPSRQELGKLVKSQVIWDTAEQRIDAEDTLPPIVL
jgi:hypothetical protein